MMIGTRALVPRLREKADLHFDVFPLPSLGRARTLADITGYCVAQGTEHLPETIDFLAYASGDEASKILAATGAVVPANLAALHSSQFVEPSRFPRNSRGLRPGDPTGRPDAVGPGVAGRGEPDPAVPGPDVLLARLTWTRCCRGSTRSPSRCLTPPTPSATPSQ